MEAPHIGEPLHRPNKTKAHRILTYRRENLRGKKNPCIREKPEKMLQATILELFRNTKLALAV